MKRIFLSMPILAMVTMIALFSCNKIEEIKPEQKNTVIMKSSKLNSNIDIGFYHNEVLGYLHRTYDVKNINNISSIIDTIANYLNTQENVDLHLNSSKLEELKSQYIPIYEFSQNKQEFKARLTNFLLDKKEISKELSKELYNLSDNNYMSIEASINAIIKKHHLSEKELNYLETMKNVAKYSDYYWTNGSGNNGDEPPVFWDAAGSLIGLFGGPAWSIIQGALASYIMAGPITFSPPSNIHL